MFKLSYETPVSWVAGVEADLIAFLQDHAANEHRVSRSALSLALQHPERELLVDAMVQVSIEELDHFRQIYEILKTRGATLGHEHPDNYMRQLRKEFANADRDRWLLHRLVLFAVVERRGFERFALLGEHLSDTELRDTYRLLAQSEARHAGLYLRLARTYFDEAVVKDCLDQCLEAEARVMRAQPLGPTLH